MTEHFTCFTANYCQKTEKEKQEDKSTDGICYLEDICRPDSPLSPKLPDKHVLFTFHLNFNIIPGD